MRRRAPPGAASPAAIPVLRYALTALPTGRPPPAASHRSNLTMARHQPKTIEADLEI
ncbi:hypothetical protein OG895_14870 [Streptomyces sp. NBC_00201]|uniref:hypothetical protein n=1 Tax=unclassified Streptomyces TaxID=2593676 RepID=UPI00225171BA|nr:hypothetical protein [Streptomyces sp. NBC_00183]MCX5246502.1 hypothetical protein [Streptomyces sp. NBC_00201]MCX5287679.1 hypothetical protein [Streptomyces sp. NBC_00183]